MQAYSLTACVSCKQAHPLPVRQGVQQLHSRVLLFNQARSLHSQLQSSQLQHSCCMSLLYV